MNKDETMSETMKDAPADALTVEPSESAKAQSYHYHVMRRALDKIDAAGERIPLESLATELNMSPAHFQRLFSAWVGVSPKRYQQYLTLEHAKALLAERHTVLETAVAAGLSGTGRLHDLFLRWDAMSPGEYARRGKGLTIRQGWFASPFGAALAMGTDKGHVRASAFAAECGRVAALAGHGGALARRAVSSMTRTVCAPWVEAAFEGRGEAAAAHDRRAVSDQGLGGAAARAERAMSPPIPTSRTPSASPRAVRAVGTAVGRNPVSFLIPCHRAMRKSGGLGGYHWGLPVKRAMLAWESARAEA